jgi:hypothetical protein
VPSLKTPRSITTGIVKGAKLLAGIPPHHHELERPFPIKIDRKIIKPEGISAVLARPGVAILADHRAQRLLAAVCQGHHELAGAIDQGTGQADAVVTVLAIPSVLGHRNGLQASVTRSMTSLVIASTSASLPSRPARRPRHQLPARRPLAPGFRHLGQRLLENNGRDGLRSASLPSAGLRGVLGSGTASVTRPAWRVMAAGCRPREPARRQAASVTSAFTSSMLGPSLPSLPGAPGTGWRASTATRRCPKAPHRRIHMAPYDGRQRAHQGVNVLLVHDGPCGERSGREGVFERLGHARGIKGLVGGRQGQRLGLREFVGAGLAAAKGSSCASRFARASTLIILLLKIDSVAADFQRSPG